MFRVIIFSYLLFCFFFMTIKHFGLYWFLYVWWKYYTHILNCIFLLSLVQPRTWLRRSLLRQGIECCTRVVWFSFLVDAFFFNSLLYKCTLTRWFLTCVSFARVSVINSALISLKISKKKSVISILLALIFAFIYYYYYFVAFNDFQKLIKLIFHRDV